MNDLNPLFSFISIPKNKIFSVNFYHRENRDDWFIKKHYHNIYEIVLYREISGSVSLNNSEHFIDSFKLLYIPPYAVHGFTLPKQSCDYIVLHTSHSFLVDLPQYPKLFNLDIKTRDTLEELLHWVNDLSNSDEFKYSIIKTIFSWINENQNDSNKKFHYNTNYFTPLLKYINENKVYNITVIEAAEISNMSRSSFLKHFKGYFNVSFHNFLLERRVDEAKYLLLNSDLTCLEISLQLGFSDSSHFTRVFKKITGQLPKNFKSSDS
ncbi:AraC family transcriptional regulator [Thiospirochaeta perfilievii]|uniref:AraC family transcriptional regulator n=1 Tax=Thiospirochaeta perfilievii TaxID=252967 RepID=A0A5C1QBV7_9SPIO|nr:helix-turn-helix domain-containing protein [Thiospirochaeta perfilievii]QEN03682.1 AraC family transcriptional regulator [Thiospirochaeta perfilievii]